MKSYSDDLRERVWRACSRRVKSPSAVAEDFGVSRSFVFKLLRRHREEGTLAAKPRGGNRPAALDARALEALRRLVRERPDATLAGGTVRSARGAWRREGTRVDDVPGVGPA